MGLLTCGRGCRGGVGGATDEWVGLQVRVGETRLQVGGGWGC